VPEYHYAKGRISESIQFIVEELREYDTDYSQITWDEYRDDKKIQKLIDRTVENILTAAIETCGTLLAEEGIAAANYAEVLAQGANLLGFSAEDQENLSKLAAVRNRLAHRYLNFRWQSVQLFAEQRELILNLITKTLAREETRES